MQIRPSPVEKVNDPWSSLMIAACLTLVAPQSAVAQYTYKTEGHTFQDIDIVSLPESYCTLTRAGKPFYGLRLPASDGNWIRLAIVKVDLTYSQADIVVTCRKQGYYETSVSLSYGPQEWIIDGPPCTAGDTECIQHTRSGRMVLNEYPEVARLYLKAK
jgi:hypothetical protein